MIRNTRLSGLLLCVLSAATMNFAGSNKNEPESFQNSVLAAKTSEEFKSLFSKSVDPSAKIIILQALPMAIARFHASVEGATVPDWLATILNDGLNSSDAAVVVNAVDQIGKNRIVSFSNGVIAKYGVLDGTLIDPAIVPLRIKIIQTAGNLATPQAVSMLGQIIDTHQLRPETDAAIIAAGISCLVDIVPQINSYSKDLNDRIANSEFQNQDLAKKPLVSPENSLKLAMSAVQAISSGGCGK
jgi:hypothetical protein